MELTHLQPRDVLHCGACALVQTSNVSGRCRRCGQNLNVGFLEIDFSSLTINQSQPARESFPSRLGAVLRSLRRRRGITQSTLARKLHISRSELSRAETGRVLPPLRMVLLIATQLGVDHLTLRIRDLSP